MIRKTAALLVFMILSLHTTLVHAEAPSKNAVLKKTDIQHPLLLNRLKGLSDHAKSRALDRLRSLEVPANDHSVIGVDTHGELYYVDPPKINASSLHSSALLLSSQLYSSIDTIEAFSLHSKPGASHTIIVDFDGHVIKNTAWNGTYSELHARPYDLDGNDSSFTQIELTAIAHIWHRIAEDFSSFDVNVTTEEPPEGFSAGRILITRNSDALGNPMPHSGAGGVAYLGVWGYSNFSYYLPALVYFNNLGSGNVHYTAEAASHEMGHILGLSHDGTTQGVSYYTGHGVGLTQWAPIMGVGYYAHVTQWDKGAYLYANNLQDDLAIIANKLSYTVDDHGDTASSASILQVEPDGSILVSTPADDPFNVNSSNKGVIERSEDRDVFMFTAGAGQLTLTVEPAWSAFYNSGKRGSNLDITARLWSALGELIMQSGPSDDTQATVSAVVSPGVYYLEVTNDSTGDPTTGYTDYASLGQYYISGSIVPGSGSGGLPPEASDDLASLNEDTSVSVRVLDNDSDPKAEAFSIFSVSSPSNGSVFVEGDLLLYTPNPNFYGLESLTYTIVNASGLKDTALLQLNVLPVNDAPVAQDDSVSARSGESITIDPLSNDFDIDGDALTVSLVSGPDFGSVGQVGNRFNYSAPVEFVGNDAFSYQIQDASGSTAVANIQVVVSAPLTPAVTPSLFSGVDNGSAAAFLSWKDTESEEGYEIQRENLKTKGKVGWVNLAEFSVVKNISTYVDPVDNGTYRYRIRSYNALGSSAWSDWLELVIASGSGGAKKGGGSKR